MDIGGILSRAWKTIWKHKILWLFGLLAGCGAASSGGGNGGSASSSAIQGSSQNGTWGSPAFISPSTERAIEDFFQTLADIPVWVWIVAALALVVASIIFSILFLLLRNLGTTGVIKGASMADQAGEDDKPLSFGEIFKGVQPHYWKVLLFNVGYQVATSLIIFILLFPIVVIATCTCGLGLFFLIPIGWFLAVMVYFTTIAIIEEELSIFQAIARAWQIIIRHLGHVVVMFLILGIGQAILSLVISLPLLVSFVPLVVTLLVSGFGSLTIGLVISGVLFLAFLPLTIFLGGVLNAFVLVSWTLTYRRLATEDELSPEVIKKTTKK